jgi:hypothetical protein
MALVSLPPRPGRPEPPETTITCVDCGGVSHLLTTWPDDDPPHPGDILVYRCADCWDRWDTIMPDEPEA